ncbi:MAG: hypothetical protein ABSF80_11305 [Chitinispirillaceae bacterium]|jgi:uncharacterized membrane protein YqaE (UPF0057 family)
MSKIVKQSIGLFLVSFAALFLEVALIRWLSTEIRIFAYINNLVILSCFVGIGLGCYFSNKRSYLVMTLALLSLLVLLVSLPLTIHFKHHTIHLIKDTPVLLGAFSDSIIWSGIGGSKVLLSSIVGLTSTMVVFFIVFFAFVPLGQILGRALQEHEHAIAAYSINIAASLLGVWSFGWLSFVDSQPWLWFTIFCVVIALLVFVLESHPRSSLIGVFFCLAAILIVMKLFTSAKADTYTRWSPYQKLDISQMRGDNDTIPLGYLLYVNNTGYMGLLNLSEPFIKKYPHFFDYNLRKYCQYDIPYMFHQNAKDVLIVGAGAGNDVAGALRNGVDHVDAVEIDPVIYDMGRTLHPERPYSDPRVHMIIDDARSAFKKLHKKYDVISFGLLDAHTPASNYNNMRIDHYVYTEESFREAKNLLAKGGILTVIFEVEAPWIGRRIYDLLATVFQTPPLALSIRIPNFGWGGKMFVAGDADRIRDAVKNNPTLGQFIINVDPAIGYDLSKESNPRFHQEVQKPVKLTTDDWPYLYLAKPAIPKLHLCVILVLAAIFLITRKYLLPRGQRVDFHFFFLGAAFLLLEFQNISKSALLFGTTWIVNLFTISAILILALCANLVVSLVKIKKIKVLYLFLLFYMVALFFMPLSLFNSWGYWQKSFIVSIILNLPIFFSGIIFTTSFAQTEYKDRAFGSNIMGAAVGGVLESLSFIFGVKALLLVAMGLYFLSALFYRPQR